MKYLDTLADAAGRAIGSDPESAAELLSFQSQCDPSAVLALVAAARALEKLAMREELYRVAHDLHGDDSREAGYAWDQMRHAGDAARSALAAIRGWNEAQEAERTGARVSVHA